MNLNREEYILQRMGHPIHSTTVRIEKKLDDICLFYAFLGVIGLILFSYVPHVLLLFQMIFCNVISINLFLKKRKWLVKSRETDFKWQTNNWFTVFGLFCSSIFAIVIVIFSYKIGLSLFVLSFSKKIAITVNGSILGIVVMILYYRTESLFSDLIKNRDNKICEDQKACASDKNVASRETEIGVCFIEITAVFMIVTSCVSNLRQQAILYVIAVVTSGILVFIFKNSGKKMIL